ncbi:hypothetical protein [Anabaena subtropica]|uniref:PEP-CTERM sorting domain-containing protein n=1 Tax=Anabaena subtropica FACHB-260 TaxID=2692884 RepID=A0ABR8CKU4_9NOST|nr:hypothetical protein [Anabaena subtropica]MBD2343599.1 hypothetical protein [Anabaena subtropica FACHB-260]
MKLNQIVNISAIAQILAIALSIFPESAQAGFARASSSAVNTTDSFSFEIDTSVTDTKTAPGELNIGLFPNAIKNAFYEVGPDSSFSTSVFFIAGDLKTSLIEDPLILADLNDEPDFYSSFGGRFINKAIRYEARLEDASGENFIEFEFFAPFTDPNSLSVFNFLNLAEFLNSDGIVIFPRNLGSLNFAGSDERNGFKFTPADVVAQVPDPSVTAALLGVGIMKTLVAVKPQKRWRN